MKKLIKGFEYYSITEEGIIYNHKTNRVIKPWLHKNGYYCIDLHKNNKKYKQYLHRLLAQTFIPNPENKRTVNHIDGIKTNNTLSNLEWATDSEQRFHAIKLGLMKYKRKLTKEDLTKAFELFLSHINCTTICSILNCSSSTLSIHLREYVISINKLEEYQKELKYQQFLRSNRETNLNDYLEREYLQVKGNDRHLEKDDDIV